MVYTSHYMEEVEQICGRIMICDRGRAVAQGTADELKRMISLGEKVTAEVGDLPMPRSPRCAASRTCARPSSRMARCS